MKNLYIVNIFGLVLFLTFNSVQGDSCELLTIRDFEKYAHETLPRNLRDFIEHGAGDDLTLRYNKEELSKIKVIPRHLFDVSNRTTKVEIFGREYDMPIGIAPSGLHKRWHVEGENATVRATEAAGTIMILSSASSNTFEEVAESAPHATKWSQMFLYRNLSITKSLIRKSEANGFSAIVISVDMPVKSLRYHNLRNSFENIHPMVNLLPFADVPSEQKRLDASTWENVGEIVKDTTLPIIVKGVLAVEDVMLAKKHGAKGVIISNHGGRQLDGAISSIEALVTLGQEHPELIRHENNDFDIYVDGGIRSGLDVFRALALGAKFVFVGRAPMWGLHHSGQKGVEAVLGILRKELYTVMGQAGVNSVSSIGPSYVKYSP